VAARAEALGISVQPDLLDRKALGVAYALRTARDHLEEPADSQTKRVLSAYYGMMSFLSAVLIADPTSTYDLEALELATKAGHGLNSIDDDEAEFPVAQKTYVTNNGFIHRYLKHIGAKLADVRIAQRFERIGDLANADRDKLMSLDGLLARVPELADFYFEVTGRAPLAAQVFASDRMFDAHADAIRAGGFVGGQSVELPRLQWVGVRAPGIQIASADRITSHLGMPLGDIQVEEDKPLGDSYLIGSVAVPEGMRYWHEALALYKSPMCPRSWFRPLPGGITDPLVLHFCTLYVLSIIVRYRPKLWREITEGGLTQYFALLCSYLAVVDRVVPELVLERIAGREVLCTQPGSFDAPL